VGTIRKKATDTLQRLREFLTRPDSMINRLCRNFSIGFLGTTSLFLLTFLLIPVLTKNLSLEDYGRIIIVGNFFQFSSLFIRVRINDLIYRFLPEFENAQDPEKVSALLRLSLLICFSACGVVFMLVVFGGQWIAENVYRDQSLYPLLVIQMTSGALMPLEEFSKGLLRIRDRFSALIFPQVAGTAISVVLVAVLIFFFNLTSLPHVIGALVVGQIFGLLVPFVASLKLFWPEIRHPLRRGLWESLSGSGADIWSTVFQTNLVNYLKVGAQEGGIFLLSVLASPEQVAIYGMANKLARPMLILQDNLQQALNPEIVKLWGQHQYRGLSHLVKRIMKTTITVGGLVVIVGLLLAKPVVLVLTTEKYLAAIPVFYVALITAFITFVSMPFFYVSLCMGQLHRRNLAVSIRFIYMGIFCLTGLTAFNLALAQLLGAVTTRLLNDFPVMRRLQTLAREESQPTDKEVSNENAGTRY
jgi:O-antigen/teichoic acid export membrane protein